MFSGKTQSIYEIAHIQFDYEQLFEQSTPDLLSSFAYPLSFSNSDDAFSVNEGSMSISAQRVTLSPENT